MLVNPLIEDPRKKGCEEKIAHFFTAIYLSFIFSDHFYSPSTLFSLSPGRIRRTLTMRPAKRESIGR